MICDLCFVGLWEVSMCPMCLKRWPQSVRWRLGTDIYNDYVCDTDRLIYGLCIVAFVPMEANKKNGFTVTWSKFPGIKNAFDPQEQLLQTLDWTEKKTYLHLIRSFLTKII